MAILIPLKYKDVKKFSLEGHEYVAKVVDVYDADTVSIIIDFNCRPARFSCRLVGIDTPEMKTDNEKEKQLATLY